MHRPLQTALLACAAFALAVGDAAAQDVDRVSARLLEEVMPEADRIDPAEGEPPVRRAYRGEELVGYVLLTSDLPPEERGYSGPIRALVGVTPDGVITGMRVTSYRESYRYERGDFLGELWFQDQFAGKDAGDFFSVGRDVDGIAQVTISVRALARGVRNAARRVVLAYMEPPEQPPVMSEAELVELPWYEMQRSGAAVTMSVHQSRRNPYELSLIYVSSEELARRLMGRRFDSYASKIEDAGGADEVIIYVVGPAGFVSPLRSGWSIEQEGRVFEIPRERVVHVGSPGGALSGQASQVGALLLDDEDGVDIAAPLTFAFDRGRPDLGTSRVDYTSRAARAPEAEAEAEPAQPAPLVADAEVPAGGDPAVDPEAPPEAEPDTDSGGDAVASPAVDEVEVTSAEAAPPDVAEPPSAAAASTEPPAVAAPSQSLETTNVAAVSEEEMFAEETFWASWSRVGWVVLVIALACLAFFTKNSTLRWVSLGTTTVVLGWIDGGFLSISHVTGLVWVGLSAIRSDPALMVLTVFTAASMVLWGRVFCGFLCPFGALQDIIDRMVPRRFKRELPREAHLAASKGKYVILVLIMGAAIVGVPVSLYQYFEPFGTVFFLSSNVLLWSIAGVFLMASAVVALLLPVRVPPGRPIGGRLTGLVAADSQSRAV